MTSTSPSAPFTERHIGPSEKDIEKMLEVVGAGSMEELLAEAVPPSILEKESSALFDKEKASEPLSEHDAYALLKSYSDKAGKVKPMIGLGYYNCVTPEPIMRQILSDPSWYTAYTPYQAEISQGRLEMLLNFQTFTAELAGLPMANASLLDEATAAAEAMTLLRRTSDEQEASVFLVHDDIHPQTLEVLRTRAEPLDIELKISHQDEFETGGAFGALLSYPGSSGKVKDLRGTIATLKSAGVRVAVCADPLALCMLEAPGKLGASVVVGSTQRLGMPLGGGGPHAAFMAFEADLVRTVPGRIVGLSRDFEGRPALRLALQTREQHIRRGKATSNICTAQVLPAVMAAAYVIYHGREGLRRIAEHAHSKACRIAAAASAAGLYSDESAFFDTLRIKVDDPAAVTQRARAQGIALLEMESAVGISCDETTRDEDVEKILAALEISEAPQAPSPLGSDLLRSDDFLSQPVFSKYRSEQAFTRYLQRLVRKDIALDRSMIPLGSCTMKLNAAVEMAPMALPGFAEAHPFAPKEDRYAVDKVTEELRQMLMAVTGCGGCSMQPNAGSQGEYTGLLAIMSYHKSRNEGHRNVCLIPESAHGTNPASAALAGMKIINVAITEEGEIDSDDLREKASAHSKNLAALMITYPSTCGIYGMHITDICEIIHSHGGQVYMDGANLNALIGVAKPGKFGADVMHINLHKTFCIPHGGGGPGMGPVVCGEHLVEHLPGHHFADGKKIGAVSSAPHGSAMLLVISWAYMRMMGSEGLRKATAVAILAANYMLKRLSGEYQLAFAGAGGRVAHEFVLTAQSFKRSSGVTVEDIAKRLIDYGFHAPTVSFPLVGAVMIEPTESEPLEEMDRFCDAMLSIRAEIEKIESGDWEKGANPLSNSPHTADALLADNAETRHYSNETAAYPLPWIKRDKYWPPVGRIDQVQGDRKLICVLDADQEL